MGLKMDDIHMPSVASSHSNGDASATSSHQSLTELIAEKDRIESELGALSSVLDSHGVHMNTTLTTFDGYPRDDIDIAQIRTTRARIIYLRNDYKAIMSKIEAGLHSHWANSAPKTENLAPSSNATPGPSSLTESRTRADPAESTSPNVSFAKVNSVITGSPADEAGLQAGDEVIRFGPVNYMNHEKLSKVAYTVQQNQNRIITVRVSRKDTADSNPTFHDLQLTPRNNWGGRGMLGCHLLPI